jgi:hypothetical protein
MEAHLSSTGGVSGLESARRRARREKAKKKNVDAIRSLQSLGKISCEPSHADGVIRLLIGLDDGKGSISVVHVLPRDDNAVSNLLGARDLKLLNVPAPPGAKAAT